MGGRSQSPSLLDESVRAADRSPLPSLPLHMRARVHVRVLMRLVTKASTLGVVPAGVSTGKSRRVGRLGDVKEVQIFVSRVRGRVSGGSTHRRIGRGDGAGDGTGRSSRSPSSLSHASCSTLAIPLSLFHSLSSVLLCLLRYARTRRSNPKKGSTAGTTRVQRAASSERARRSAPTVGRGQGLW